MSFHMIDCIRWILNVIPHLEFNTSDGSWMSCHAEDYELHLTWWIQYMGWIHGIIKIIPNDGFDKYCGLWISFDLADMDYFQCMWCGLMNIIPHDSFSFSTSGGFWILFHFRAVWVLFWQVIWEQTY